MNHSPKFKKVVSSLNFDVCILNRIYNSVLQKHIFLSVPGVMVFIEAFVASLRFETKYSMKHSNNEADDWGRCWQLN